MTVNLIICAVTLVLGLLYTFWGYKKLRKLISFGAGVITFVIVFFAADAALNFWWSALIALVSAVAAGVLAHFFFNVGLFMLGASLGLTVSSILCTLAGITGDVFLIVLPISCAVLFGVLALKFKRVYLSIATAFTGAGAFCSSLAFIICALTLGGESVKAVYRLMGNYDLLITGCSIILGIAGTIVQLAVTAPKNKK